MRSKRKDGHCIRTKPRSTRGLLAICVEKGVFSSFSFVFISLQGDTIPKGYYGVKARAKKRIVVHFTR